MDIVQGVVGGAIKSVSAYKEGRDRKNDYTHQKEVRDEFLSLDREKHGVTMETETVRKENELLRKEREKIELQMSTLELKRMKQGHQQNEKDEMDKEMQKLSLKLREMEVNKHTDKNVMLIKAVDEGDIATLTHLVQCAEKLDPDTLSVAHEIASEKNNGTVLKLLGLIQKKIQGRKIDDVTKILQDPPLVFLTMGYDGESIGTLQICLDGQDYPRRIKQFLDLCSGISSNGASYRNAAFEWGVGYQGAGGDTVGCGHFRTSNSSVIYDALYENLEEPVHSSLPITLGQVVGSKGQYGGFGICTKSEPRDRWVSWPVIGHVVSGISFLQAAVAEGDKYLKQVRFIQCGIIKNMS